MRYINLLSVLSLFIFLTSCESGPKDLSPFMVDITDFQIETNVLEDGERVEVLGSSGNLTREHSIDFYNLVVVKSLKTGDTVNVLVTRFYESDLNDPEERFMSNTSLSGKLLERVFDGVDVKENLDGLNINDLQALSYDKVFYDSEYIQVDVREFPTVTGNLGNYTIEGDLDALSNH